MIQLSDAQMGTLQHHADARYARAEAQHLAGYAPALAGSAGDAGLQAAVGIGLAAARRAGFSEAPQIRLCLQLLTTFGSHFDTDPQCEWLHPLLSPGSPVSAAERARLLYWHATLYLARAYGPTGVHGITAAKQALRLGLADYAAVGSDYAQRAPGLIARLHPQRVPYLSRSTAAALLDAAAAQAPQRELGGPAAAPLLLALMFGFGHRVADDPLHPWVGEVLADRSLAPEARTERLHARTQATLAAWLAPIEAARR